MNKEEHLQLSDPNPDIITLINPNPDIITLINPNPDIITLTISCISMSQH